MERFLNLIKTHSLFLVGLALSIALLWPLFKAPYFSHHDDVQVVRLHQMNKCIQDFQIPCRWVPDLGGLYGYPLFNYYGPLPYYFGEAVYLVTQSFLVSAKFMFGFSFIGSYIFMYLLARKLWGEAGGALSGILYSYAPYHALDFYVRGAMGEMWALMFFPAVFYFLLRLREKVDWKSSAWLGISIALLIMSHNISTMIFFPILILAILLFYLSNKNSRFITLSLTAVILGFLISAFYFLPALVEKKLVHVDTTTMGYFSYTEHYKGLRKLFLDRSWGWGASVREIPGGEKDGMSFQIGILHVLVWGGALLFSFIYRKKEKFSFYIILFCSAIILVSIFMIHPRSLAVWKLFDFLKYLQFPWRLLMFITFFISLIAGSVVYLLKPVKLKILAFVVVVATALVLHFSYFRPEKFVYLTDDEYLSGLNWDRQIKRSIFDYLPIYAKFPPAELAKTRYEILEGKGSINDYKEGSNSVSFSASVDEKMIIRLSTYYFPNWKVFVDNKETPTAHANDLGLITLNLDKGFHTVKGKLYDTPIRTIANFLSSVGLGLVLVIYIKYAKKH